jgi:hypothetical protein
LIDSGVLRPHKLNLLLVVTKFLSCMREASKVNIMTT